MSGRPGRSGVYKRPVTSRGLRLVGADTPPADPLPAELVAGLLPGGLGLAFMERAWQDYEPWNPASLMLLREAGMTIDALELLRGQKGERQTQRLLVTLLLSLRLEA